MEGQIKLIEMEVMGVRRKGKRLDGCPLCGHSGEGTYWEIDEWDVCEPCCENYLDNFNVIHDPALIDPDLEGYIKERVAKA